MPLSRLNAAFDKLEEQIEEMKRILGDSPRRRITDFETRFEALERRNAELMAALQEIALLAPAGSTVQDKAVEALRQVAQ